jgi:hypothetical protein
LKNEHPGNQRKEKQDAQDSTRYPTCLRKNFEKITDVECGEQENNVSPSLTVKFADKLSVADEWE